jgi:acylphosphatase
MVKKAGRFIIRGTVQGVFFRQFIKTKAELLKITGFTRNLTDGSVEVVVEGDGDSIRRFQEMLTKGPEHSSVRNIQFEEKKWSGDFKDFRVLRF